MSQRQGFIARQDQKTVVICKQQTLLCGVIGGGPTEKRYGHGPGTNAADYFCVQQFGRPPVAEAPQAALPTLQ